MNELPKVDQPRQKRNKRDRIPVNGSDRNLLTIRKKDPGYEYRWVKNDPDRLAKFLDAWWEFDQDPENQAVGDRKVDTSVGTGSHVEVRAGGGKKLVLMKIPKELYKEDQDSKQRQVDLTESDMLEEATKGRYGKVEVSRGNITPPVGS